MDHGEGQTIIERTRSVVQSLLNGEPPNGTTPESCGEWAHIVADLYQAYNAGGVADVRRTFDTLARGNRRIRRLVSGEPKAGDIVPATEGTNAHPAERVSFPVPISAAELGHKQIEPTRYFIPEMLRAGLALFIGNPGIGKTPALMQLALALAAGGKWLGVISCPRCRVLYIGVEYDEAYVKETLIDSFGSADLPPDLMILTMETFAPPQTEDESLAMMRHYLEVWLRDVVIIDTFSGFLPREKFKQDKYRGDYAEFLAYQRLFMNARALIVGSWHGNKRDKDPETAYNGGQGMWGSAGGGRITMSRDEDEGQVRLRSQLRGHERREWLLEQARVGNARFWSLVDAEPDPILGSEAQRRIYQTIKRHSTWAEPLSPAGVRGILSQDAPELGLKEAYIRQALGRMAERGVLVRHGGGYIVQRAAGLPSEDA